MRGRILGQGHGLPAKEDFIEVIEIISWRRSTPIKENMLERLMSVQLERIMTAQFNWTWSFQGFLGGEWDKKT